MFFHVYKISPTIKRDKVKTDRPESIHSAKKLVKRGFKVSVMQTNVNMDEKMAYRHGIEIFNG